MRSTLPEEIEKTFQHNLSIDSTLTLSHIQRCLEDMTQEMGISANDAPTSGFTPVPIRLWFTVPELGHPLIDDNNDRPLHTLVGPFLHGYLSRYEDMDVDDDEMGHLYTGLCDARVLARTMLEDWEIEPAAEDNDNGKTILNRHLRRNRKRLSTRIQLEIPTKLRKLNLKASIYQKCYANHRRLVPSGSIMNRRAPTLHMPV